MGGGLSALSSQAAEDFPVADPDKCQHKFCEKWGPGHYHCADCHSTIQDETLIASEDAIIDSIVDESVAEDGVYRGVSIQFLVDFATTCKCWDMTTRDVRRRFVMPATRASRCRFVELPEMQQSAQKYVGRAGTFVSHTWGARFGDLVAALCDGGADRSRYVWVDIFAVRQWPSRKPDLDFSAVVRQCGSFVVVCSSLPEVVDADFQDLVLKQKVFSGQVRSQIAFLRVWCLVEVHSAILSGAAIVMKCGSMSGIDDNGLARFVTDTEMIIKLSVMVDIESADATVASDKERILNEIRASEGGVDAVNRAVRGALIGSMLSDPLVQCAACDDQHAIDVLAKSPSEYIVSAAGCGYLKLLQMLIDSGSNINQKQKFRLREFSPLEAAAAGGHTECVSLLLKCGCASADTGVLFTAAMYGHTEVARVLLDNGYDVNAERNGNFPLMGACMQGNFECAKVLIERGADANYCIDGVSAMTLAAASGRTQTLQLLIDSGASPKSEVHRGAVISAATTGSLDCLELLIKNGCDLEARVDGLTALMKAVLLNQVACVDCLLRAGCDVNAVDENEVSALDLAEFRGHTECLALLRRYTK